MYKLILLATFVIVQFNNVIGHGRLIEPASRNAMWRFKYKNPRNYNDMGLNCGGFTTQFEKNGGKCGVCGDPWTGEREHEAGGKYANGVIARQYKVGSFINVTVTLTSNHMGYFEFRLCPVNNPRVKATHACLDRHLLNIAGHGTRYFIMDKRGYVNIQMFVMLPPNLSCAQCVLQWKWVAGQSMGPDGNGGECLGCGNQENFVNCADIAIGDKVIAPLPQRVTTPSPPATTTPPPSRYQVLPVAMMSNGAIPTVHASYGAYNVAPTSDVQYNIVPIPQPPTAHASHSTGHAHHVQSHGWPGNQFTPQPAQIVYKTIQETQPKPSNGRIKVQIIRKPNPYASMKTQNAQQHAHQAPQAPKSSGPSAQAYQQHGQHSNQATQTKHGYPQANSHLSHASGSVQHAGHMQPVSYVPHANTNVAPQANGFAQMSSHTSQQQAYIQQVPTYPHQIAPAPQPPPPTYQQSNKHIQNAPQLQSQSYVPNIPQVQPVPQNVPQVQPLPQAKTNANVAPQGNIAMSAPMDFKSMKANLMKYFPNFAENLDWMNEFATPPNPTDPSQLSYPGYEPGEYPEPGESQQSSGSNGQSSSYMQGYNDAMQELKRQFGISDNSHQGGSSSAGTKCPGGAKPTCRGINQWEGQSQFDSWCTTTCTAGECPSNFCSCTCPGAGSSTWKSGLTCRGIDPAKGSSMDTWCTLNCKGGNCPSELCMCL